jgi:hypothetical protein
VSPAAVWSPGVGLQELRMTHRLSPRCLPIKLDSTSNGEFAPVPLDRAALHARTSASQAVDAARHRLGLSRRDYLVSVLGAAATLAAFDQAFAAAGRHGGRFVLPQEAPFELAAAQAAIGGDEFIFDVQLHHVNPKGAWRRRAGPEALRNFPNSACGGLLQTGSGDLHRPQAGLDDVERAVATHPRRSAAAWNRLCERRDARGGAVRWRCRTLPAHHAGSTPVWSSMTRRRAL